MDKPEQVGVTPQELITIIGNKEVEAYILRKVLVQKDAEIERLKKANGKLETNTE